MRKFPKFVHESSSLSGTTIFKGKTKDMKKPEIEKVSVDFTQEGNTLGTTSEYETINISLEFQAEEKDGAFIVLKTNGWSIDSTEELEDIINRVKLIIKSDKH